MWEVHNKHWCREKPEPAGAVYIGRPRRYDPHSSPLANPFSTELNPSRTVTVVADPLAAYRRWLWQQLQGDTLARREIARLAQLPDGVLLCGCAPAPCHGTIVARAIDWWREQQAAAVERCRSCDGPIAWGLTPTQKPCPFNVVAGVVTQQSHFETCPDARRWSKK